MQLSYAQKLEIYRRGFVQLPGVVPQVMVDAALRAINHSFGEGMDPALLNQFRSQSYCPELRQHEVITNLFNQTPASDLAASAVGRLRPVGGGQIAVRFPSLQDPPEEPRGHLDGMYSPHNGVPKGEIHNFTMLLGVMLSEVKAPFSGNLTVWPGSHHTYEQYFRAHGPEALLAGMPPVDLAPPVQVLAQPGDVVLVHYQVKHGAAPNVSPHPRYAIYFRLSHVDHEARKREVMQDIWLEWEGMKQIVAARREGLPAA
ncbi:MAG: phytanoyl-CoA dioxygenase family protein [Candidatus Latescibacteria bacterium]|nr:phytanoyl-CoA dioxygenase family protein [Candidatus Latescibacterota bacterium]